MDLQPVFSLYKAVSNMPAYFSKSESETSQALLQACSEIRSMKLQARESVHKLASFYSSSKQVFLQEVVYYSLPELWLTKCFPRTVICKSLEGIEEVNRDSTDILKWNMVDRYIDRPNSQYKNEIYGIADPFVLQYLQHTITLIMKTKIRIIISQMY